MMFKVVVGLFTLLILQLGAITGLVRSSAASLPARSLSSHRLNALLPAAMHAYRRIGSLRAEMRC